ncbi:serine/threonine-protein kinase [Sinomonas sp. P47F7]|uniref:serine/threonine-protein kinase n=1 Tax=Sinomonas sp. P47F7 TaxID=3410987 RepID=UPI003BF55611
MAARRQVGSGAEGLLGGRYRLLEAIGQGSVAVVYRALDELLDREVAVKLTKAAADRGDMRPSDAEVKLLARLNHPGLVTLLDAGTDNTADGVPRIVLVMELIEGQDLRVRLKEGVVSAPRVAEIGHDLSEALSYIHGHGVVHRDVKPANILLLDAHDEGIRAHAKLADFGLAWIADSAVTLEDAVSGTPAYLSPEQVRGEFVGPASDIYSLGLVLLQCLTGELAFPGPTLESAVRRLTQGPPLGEDVDAGWRDLIAAMTGMDPEGRPSAEEVAAALYRMATTVAVPAAKEAELVLGLGVTAG